VTDYSPYYPPRCAIQTEWYAANPGFHPVPPGYGLPWGTIEEQNIPSSLIFEAEMALAKEQMKTQTPACPEEPRRAAGPEEVPPPRPTAEGGSGSVQQLAYQTPAGPGVAAGKTGATVPGLPPDWPDPRGFVPPPPQPVRPPCRPTVAPVMRHTKTYNGQDPQFTEALANYYFFQDDARFGGWQSYLQRSDDFVRFCCHMHIWEMLSARGGAGESRVVWRWPDFR
jgi:hypothetical protein